MQQIKEEMIPSASRVRRQTAGIAAGNTIEDIIYNGRKVVFKALVIKPEHVKQKTMPYVTNERDQDNLTEETLSDILPSLAEGGQTVWAIGRETPFGVIEVADGSRRRAGVIIEQKPFKILVGDLTDEEMEMISIMGNLYKTPSPIEKGRRYRRLVNQYGSLRQVEDVLRKNGERVSRRVIRRCIKAAELPKAITDLFSSLDEITPDFAETLHVFAFKELDPENGRIDADENLSDAMAKAVSCAGMVDFEKPADLVDYLVSKCREVVGLKRPASDQKPKPVKRSYGGGQVKLTQSKNRLKLDIADLNEEQITDIERFISMKLELSMDDEKQGE